MANFLEWQQGGSSPQNGDNFEQISQCWKGLDGQDIVWQQRLIPESGKFEDIDWKTQGFDERKVLNSPQVRGITFFWHQEGVADERGITPRKIIWEPNLNRLLLFSGVQENLVIRVGRSPIVYQTVELIHPVLAGKRLGNQGILLLRDPVQQIEVKVTLDALGLEQMLDLLAPMPSETQAVTPLVTPYSGNNSIIEPEIEP